METVIDSIWRNSSSLPAVLREPEKADWLYSRISRNPLPNVGRPSAVTLAESVSSSRSAQFELLQLAS